MRHKILPRQCLGSVEPAVISSAAKRRNAIAQGNALGPMTNTKPRPEGAKQWLCRPFRACLSWKDQLDKQTKAKDRVKTRGWILLNFYPNLRRERDEDKD